MGANGRVHSHGVDALPSRPQGGLGDLPVVKALEPRHVMELRDRYADVPPAGPKFHAKPTNEYLDRRAAVNNLLRALSAMIKWSIPRGWRPDNPCRDVPKLTGGDGYAPWPMRAIEHYREHGRPHLFGTSQRMRSIPVSARATCSRC